jgi:DNA polymerase III alpha subunit
MSLEAAARLWELMASFAGYGFLKAHAASYAVIAYQTAYLKAHHPAELMTALLRNWGGYYPQYVYLEEARRLGMELHPPHINHSRRRFEIDYAPDDHPKLWMGLGQIRELTRKTTSAILQARRLRPFASMDDLIERAHPRLTEAENLVKAGALDGLGAGRRAMLNELGRRTRGAPMQLALPFEWKDEEAQPGLSQTEELAMEVEMLGWPVSAHALRPFAHELDARGVVRSDNLARHLGDRVAVAGARLSLWGERRGKVLLSDEAGLFVVGLPGGRLRPGRLGRLGPYVAHGRVQADQTGELSVLLDSIEPL